MATRLWQFIKRRDWTRGRTSPEIGWRWAQFYITRKPWRKPTRHRIDTLVISNETRRVRYLGDSDPMNAGWDKVSREALQFYFDRKIWKKLSNYTQARLRNEWRDQNHDTPL